MRGDAAASATGPGVVEVWARLCGVDPDTARGELAALRPALAPLGWETLEALQVERLGGRLGCTVLRLSRHGTGQIRSVVVRRYGLSRTPPPRHPQTGEAAPGPEGRATATPQDWRAGGAISPQDWRVGGAVSPQPWGASRRWLAHAEAMEAACGEALPRLGVPSARLLAMVEVGAGAARLSLLLIEDAGRGSLADWLAEAAAPGARERLLVAAVEALERLHATGEAGRRELRRGLRPRGETLWRWQAGPRGEELCWHVGRLLRALGREPGAAERAVYEEGLFALAAWAAERVGAVCHGRAEPAHFVGTEDAPRLIDWQEAHWGVPEYDLATLDRLAGLPAAALDRYCERRRLQRRAIFESTLARCRVMVEIERLGRSVPAGLSPDAARSGLRAAVAEAVPRLDADPHTRALGRLLHQTVGG